MDDPTSDDYVPPWRKGTVTMDGGELPVFNGHMVQLKARGDVRPAALDEAIQAKRKAPKERASGHSLMRW